MATLGIDRQPAASGVTVPVAWPPGDGGCGTCGTRGGLRGDCPVYVARDEECRRLFLLPYGKRDATAFVGLIQQRLVRQAGRET